MRCKCNRALATLLAVLCALTGAGAGEMYGNVSRVRRSSQLHQPHRVLTDEEIESNGAWKRAHWREMQMIMREEGDRGDMSCCPTVKEMVAPVGGIDPQGRFLELFKDPQNEQRFYEFSCAEGVENKPCRFVDARLYNQSRCVQKYSYSYALVRNTSVTEMPQTQRDRREAHFPVQQTWSLDYIRVRSGCHCVITPKRKIAHHRRRLERHRQRRPRYKMHEEIDKT